MEQLSEAVLVGGKGNICSGCKVARYCGKECQVGAVWHRAMDTGAILTLYSARASGNVLLLHCVSALCFWRVLLANLAVLVNAACAVWCKVARDSVTERGVSVTTDGSQFDIRFASALYPKLLQSFFRPAVVFVLLQLQW
jgi:hypothetical protein